MESRTSDAPPKRHLWVILDPDEGERNAVRDALAQLAVDAHQDIDVCALPPSGIVVGLLHRGPVTIIARIPVGAPEHDVIPLILKTNPDARVFLSGGSSTPGWTASG